jgi:hypothetical protein
MKTPRIHDFDPNAKIPSLGSPMDNLPAIQKPTLSNGKKPTGEPEAKEIPSVPSTPISPYGSSPVPGTVPPPVPRTVSLRKRKMKQRHPFDIYEDQYETLKTIAEEEREQGLPGSMSAMVRKGIDMYLEERKKGKI